MTLLEKARANRLAALASLENANDNTPTIVSIFDFEPAQNERPIPAFTSIRTEGNVVRLAA